MVWTSWSVIDSFTPEIFSFGFDPEILSCFWGIFRSSNDIGTSGPRPPRIIPDAPFQIIVPFRHSDTGFLSFLQSACGVVLVVSLSSYGVYSILQSARGKLMKDDDDGSILMVTQNHVNLSQKAAISSSEHNVTSHEGSNNELVRYNDPRVTPPPIRPTTLTVGVRSQSDKIGLLSHRLHKISKDYEVDLDQVEDIQDIEAEYFGPDTIDMDNSFDDAEFQTPCAGT